MSNHPDAHDTLQPPAGDSPPEPDESLGDLLHRAEAAVGTGASVEALQDEIERLVDASAAWDAALRLADDRPWRRVKPAERLQLPDFALSPSAAGIGDDLRDWVLDLHPVDFVRLVREQLVPQGDFGSGLYHAWEALWAQLSTPALQPFTELLLDQWQGLVDTIHGDDHDADADSSVMSEVLVAMDDTERKRFKAFAGRVNQAEDRLERIEGPLSWLHPKRRAAIPRRARPALDRLVRAIDAHRETVRASGHTREADEQLWSVLRELKVDPQYSARFRR